MQYNIFINSAQSFSVGEETGEGALKKHVLVLFYNVCC